MFNFVEKLTIILDIKCLVLKNCAENTSSRRKKL